MDAETIIVSFYFKSAIILGGNDWQNLRVQPITCSFLRQHREEHSFFIKATNINHATVLSTQRNVKSGNMAWWWYPSGQEFDQVKSYKTVVKQRILSNYINLECVYKLVVIKTLISMCLGTLILGASTHSTWWPRVVEKYFRIMFMCLCPDVLRWLLLCCLEKPPFSQTWSYLKYFKGTLKNVVAVSPQNHVFTKSTAFTDDIAINPFIRSHKCLERNPLLFFHYHLLSLRKIKVSIFRSQIIYSYTDSPFIQINYYGRILNHFYFLKALVVAKTVKWAMDSSTSPNIL